VVVEHCEDITFTNLALSGKDLAAEASGTPPNFMEISQSRNVFSPNIQVETVESSSAAIRAGIALKGSNSNVRLRVTANVQTTNKPTVALVEYSGSNNNDCDVDAAYINNAGSAALFSGGPTRGIAKDRNYYLNGGTGLIRETYPVDEAGANLSAGGTGIMYYSAIVLFAGDVVTNLSFAAATTPLTMGSNADGNLWFALYDSTAALLRQTADQGGSATWAANTAKTLALSSAYTVLTTGVYYATYMVNSGTGGSPATPTTLGKSILQAGFTGGLVSGQKVRCGSTGSTLTTTAPASFTPATGNSKYHYAVAS
jgi:hypothetical protein